APAAGSRARRPAPVASAGRTPPSGRASLGARPCPSCCPPYCGRSTIARLAARRCPLFHRRPPPVPIGTYTTWSWPPTESGYTGFGWALEPRTDPSPVGYFWSHQVALIGGEAAYVGLQTRGSEPTGKIAIFSVWGAIDAESPEFA